MNNSDNIIGKLQTLLTIQKKINTMMNSREHDVATLFYLSKFIDELSHRADK